MEPLAGHLDDQVMQIPGGYKRWVSVQVLFFPLPPDLVRCPLPWPCLSPCICSLLPLCQRGTCRVCVAGERGPVHGG